MRRWFDRFDDWVMRQEPIVGAFALTVLFLSIGAAVTGAFLGLIFFLRWVLPV